MRSGQSAASLPVLARAVDTNSPPSFTGSPSPSPPSILTDLALDLGDHHQRLHLASPERLSSPLSQRRSRTAGSPLFRASLLLLLHLRLRSSLADLRNSPHAASSVPQRVENTLARSVLPTSPFSTPSWTRLSRSLISSLASLFRRPVGSRRARNARRLADPRVAEADLREQ